MTKINYENQGRTVIAVFLKYYRVENGKSLTQSELFSKILRFDENKFLNNLGYSYVVGLKEDREKLEEAMESLANKTRGGFPETSGFGQAMLDANGTFALIKEVSSQVASDIGAGVTSFAENSLALVKFLNSAFPILVVGGIAFFIYKNKDLLDLKNFKK